MIRTLTVYTQNSCYVFSIGSWNTTVRVHRGGEVLGGKGAHVGAILPELVMDMISSTWTGACAQDGCGVVHDKVDIAEHMVGLPLMFRVQEDDRWVRVTTSPVVRVA